MFKEKFAALKQELLSFSRSEKIFIFSAMLCGFFISAEYAVIRPVSNSVFIYSYGSSFFPYAWLATVPLNLFIVSLYNRFLPRLGCYKMLLYIVSVIVGGNIFCALFLKQIPLLPFLFYIWKEVYILLMFQQLWSVIHATIRKDRAKYLYGLLFAVGGLGGVCGSVIPGFFAVKAGSENLLFMTLPLYLGLLFFFKKVLGHAQTTTLQEQLKEGRAHLSFKESLSLIGRSRYLIFILLIVILMQTSCAVVDFQFNSVLEKIVPEKDLRTEYLGRILGLVNLCTIILQLVGTFIIIQLMGLRRSHYFVPSILGINALGFVLYPVFGMISFCYVTIKSLDFSIFNVIKEMLYLPLKVDEKFQAKAIIDVFAYRTSKACASLLILFFQFFAASSSLTILSWGSVLLFVLWYAVVLRMWQKEDQLSKAQL